MDLLGAVAVVDLEAACDLYGRDALPHPLGRTRPVGSLWLATRGVGPVEERLGLGDLREIRPWVEAVTRADVCVECRTTYRDEEALDLRLHASWAGERAFLAMQRRDVDGVDVVDLYATSPDALSHAVTEALGLTGPGALWRITVAEGQFDHAVSAAEPEDGYDDFGFPILRSDFRESQAAVVGADDVLATGTIQARESPSDVSGEVLRWVHIRDDGDYLFESEASDTAEPLGFETLVSLIDGFVGSYWR